MLSEIKFETAAVPDPQELLRFYERQGHPTPHVTDKLRRMIDHTLCFVTARRNGEVVGIARGVSDGLTGWLAECKLDPSCQGPACVTRKDGRIEDDAQGIAAEMARLVIESLRSFGAERIDTVAHGTEVDFCKDIGFRKIGGAVALVLPSDVAVNLPAAVSASSAS